MGKWYRCTKTIRGRKYDYWQQTYRVGRSVKTRNKYIGPTGGCYSVRRLVDNEYRTYYITKKDNQHFITISGNPDSLWVEQPFPTRKAAADYGAKLDHRHNIERAKEGLEEDQYFYDHHATPEQRKEMEETTPGSTLPLQRRTKPC